MPAKNNTFQQAIRWLARGISTFAAVFWLLILLDILACDALAGFICLDGDLVFLLGIVVASVLCVIVAWRREGVGGSAMFLWGLAFSTFAYLTGNSQRTYSVMIAGVPFLIASLLFLVSWWTRSDEITNA